MDGLLSFLTPEQQAAAERQARQAMLTQLGFGLLQASTGAPGQRRPSLGQIVGQAGPGAMQAYQGGFDRTLQQIMLSQQMAQQEQQREAQARLAQRLTPEQQEQVAAFGSGVLQQLAMPPRPETRILSPGQAIFEGAQQIAGLPAEPKAPPGVVGEYQAALSAGLLPQGTTLDQFIAMKKPPAAVATAIAGLGKDLTPGQKKRDEKAAEDIYQWESGGGQDMVSQIAQLKPVIAALEAGQPITGIRTAIQPDLLLALTNPKAVGAKEAVAEVVQRNLRVILGAQFTEKEGKMLMDRAYNPALPPEENARRVRRLLKQMETAAEQKQAMADYFNQNGTLVGFKGKMPTVRDFENAMEKGSSAPPVKGPLRFNPVTRELE
jgi:hypothetical protein